MSLCRMTRSTCQVRIPAADAYGERDESMVAKLDLAMLPGIEDVPVGA